MPSFGLQTLELSGVDEPLLWPVTIMVVIIIAVITNNLAYDRAAFRRLLIWSFAMRLPDKWRSWLMHNPVPVNCSVAGYPIVSVH